jgi:uncharacterized protein (TIGR00725 family)
MIYVGVIGGSIADEKNLKIAYEVGKYIAENGWILVCGGLTGVMESAAKGAFENNGTTIGILPGSDKNSANKYIKFPIATGLGIARNYIIIQSSDILIAINGSYGTLNEISAALNLKKRVIAINSWKLEKAGVVDKNLFYEASTPEEAISIAKRFINGT